MIRIRSGEYADIHIDIRQFLAVRIINGRKDHLTGAVTVTQSVDHDIRIFRLGRRTEDEDIVCFTRVCHGIAILQSVDLCGILVIDLQPDQRGLDDGRFRFRIVVHTDPVAVHRVFSVFIKQHHAHILEFCLIAHGRGEDLVLPQGTGRHIGHGRSIFRGFSGKQAGSVFNPLAFHDVIPVFRNRLHIRMVCMHHVVGIVELIVFENIGVRGAGCKPGFAVSVIIHPDPDWLRSIVKEEQNIIVPDNVAADLKIPGFPEQDVRRLRIPILFKCRNQFKNRFRIRALCLYSNCQSKHCQDTEHQGYPFLHGDLPPNR